MSSGSAAAARASQPDGAAPAQEDGRRIRVLRDPAELASVREAWLRMQQDQIAADPDFFAAAQLADPKIVRPHVVVLERDGEPEAMLIGRVERLELGVRAGYRKLYAPRVHSLTVVYGGVLGAVDGAGVPPPARQCAARSPTARSDRDGDPEYLLATRPSTSGSRRPSRPSWGGSTCADSEIHWELTLPGSVDEILGALSSSTRQTA